jgi:hypothetical protein
MGAKDEVIKALKKAQDSDTSSLVREAAQSTLNAHMPAIRQMEAAELKRVENAHARVRYIREQIAKGQRTYLYNRVYLPVDSIVLEKPLNSDFNIDRLQELGIQGWEIVSVIPRTIGVALTNTLVGSTTGQTWGAGIGGNVIGAYILLKREITADDDRLSDDDLLKYTLWLE